LLSGVPGRNICLPWAEYPRGWIIWAKFSQIIRRAWRLGIKGRGRAARSGSSYSPPPSFSPAATTASPSPPAELRPSLRPALTGFGSPPPRKDFPQAIFAMDAGNVHIS
jgi:hypothetical protein